MKIFGIGLSRTGTKSLSAALNLLGFNVGHYDAGMAAIGWEGQTLVLDTNAIARLDGLTDIPAAAFYMELDTAFAGAKFILTVRDKADWTRSISRHLESNTQRYRSDRQILESTAYGLRSKMYGAIHFEPDVHSAAFDRHHRDVAAYFVDRPDDLLTLDICGGDGWRRLCGFLGVDIPDAPFPMKNVRSRPKGGEAQTAARS